MRCGTLVLLALAGCGPDEELVPRWVVDTVYLEPASGDAVYGFQTWEFFAERWEKRLAPKHYVCGIVVELHGEPTEDCSACLHAWAVTGELLESDCPFDLYNDPTWFDLIGLGTGPIPAELTEGDPYPGTSQGGYADYGVGRWVPHGWAYPEALDGVGFADSPDWDGEQAFVFWPAYAWELDG